MTDVNNFAIIVSEDIKNKTSQHEKDMLRLPENHEKWRSCLIDIIETVSNKISELDADILSLRESYSDFVSDPAAGLEDQKEKSKRFRFYAEKRLAEVDRLISLGESDDKSLSLATFLREAISRHKKIVIESGCPSAADIALWSALDGEWKF